VFSKKIILITVIDNCIYKQKDHIREKACPQVGGTGYFYQAVSRSAGIRSVIVEAGGYSWGEIPSKRLKAMMKELRFANPDNVPMASSVKSLAFPLSIRSFAYSILHRLR
jgi:hypothetical protein